jgi:hypothetical protein
MHLPFIALIVLFVSLTVVSIRMTDLVIMYSSFDDKDRRRRYLHLATILISSLSGASASIVMSYIVILIKLLVLHISQ